MVLLKFEIMKVGMSMLSLFYCNLTILLTCLLFLYLILKDINIRGLCTLLIYTMGAIISLPKKIYIPLLLACLAMLNSLLLGAILAVQRLVCL